MSRLSDLKQIMLISTKLLSFFLFDFFDTSFSASNGFVICLYLELLMISINHLADTNECKQHGICSQKCVDLKGSYKCLCLDGYQLDGDMKTCRASGMLKPAVFQNLFEVITFFLTN